MEEASTHFKYWQQTDLRSMFVSQLPSSPGEIMSSQLTSELKKQKHLYDELLRKTQQLQRLQTVSCCSTYSRQVFFPSYPILMTQERLKQIIKLLL